MTNLEIIARIKLILADRRDNPADTNDFARFACLAEVTEVMRYLSENGSLMSQRLLDEPAFSPADRLTNLLNFQRTFGIPILVGQFTPDFFCQYCDFLSLEQFGTKMTLEIFEDTDKLTRIQAAFKAALADFLSAASLNKAGIQYTNCQSLQAVMSLTSGSLYGSRILGKEVDLKDLMIACVLDIALQEILLFGSGIQLSRDAAFLPVFISNAEINLKHLEIAYQTFNNIDTTKRAPLDELYDTLRRLELRPTAEQLRLLINHQDVALKAIDAKLLTTETLDDFVTALGSRRQSSARNARL